MLQIFMLLAVLVSIAMTAVIFRDRKVMRKSTLALVVLLEALEIVLILFLIFLVS